MKLINFMHHAKRRCQRGIVEASEISFAKFKATLRRNHVIKRRKFTQSYSKHTYRLYVSMYVSLYECCFHCWISEYERTRMCRFRNSWSSPGFINSRADDARECAAIASLLLRGHSVAPFCHSLLRIVFSARIIT
jgi:hypothetical protein